MAKTKSHDKSRKGLPALDKSPSHLLHRALQLALDIYADELGVGAITQRQFAVLAAVEAHEGLTQTDLVKITGIDRSTLADMAARMIVKGLLERHRSTADARANAVSLTDAGRAALDGARPKMLAADARLLRLISTTKRESLVSGLRDLIRAGEDVGAPAPEKLEKKIKAEKPKKALKADKAEKPKKKKLKKAA
ncbi:MarR family winged helix-turn-helix transcriptional regulator [Phenylobacterium sp. Root700]|uniref:MarR family winged helix-turn-helix transcriptional regulator n=1 Tax=Phenylobacterium sp. Root700 TaxID=1736591 RepID=UPI0006F473CD|nr:MarR family winged helix-turn-helix transcriptional regulator [Phenylobacterium sp. Root700]KRB40713.1 MarR family transcriptional regulator [Phenylobacterium sp. Root700]